MMWIIYGYRCTLGHVSAADEAEALAKGRALWGNLAVVYAQPWGGP